MVLLAPMIALAGVAPLARDPARGASMRLIGLGGSYVPGGDATVMMQRPFIGNLFTSDPVRYARNVAVLEAEARRSGSAGRRSHGRMPPSG